MKINILVIEDHEADTELIKYYLNEAGFKHNFFSSETLSEGIDIIKENKIDLVLLDLSLPDSNGFNTLRSFLSQVNHIPVIIMTNTNNEVVGIQSVKAGAQDFLIKGDFNNRSLIRTIRYSLQRFKTNAKLKDEAEQASMNQKLYQIAQEMAKFASWEMDIVNNSMKWSDEMFRIFGFSPHTIEPSQSEYINFVHMEDKEKVETFFEDVIKEGKKKKIDHRIIIDGKNIKHLTLQAEVNFDEDLNKILLIGSVQDITERITGNYQSDSKPLKNNNANKIKKEVLSELSFNIRTPFSSIAQLLFLFENTELNSEQKELIDNLKTSVDDLSIILNNLLNFSLLVIDNTTIEEEEFNFPDFIFGFKRVLQIRAAQSKVSLELDTNKNLPEKVISDPQKITQLLYNVINNAINQSEEGNFIQIVIDGKKESARDYKLIIKINYKGSRSSIRTLNELNNIDKLLTIYEDGKKSNQKKNFEKYIVAKLIKAFNGNYQVLNIQDKSGIRVQLEIPIGIKTDQGINTGVLEKPSQPLSILLVEDHAINQIVTKKTLSTWSSQISVDVANNGQKCLDKMEQKQYDLVLMDLQMPIMDGIEASIKIRMTNDIPIIALTANASKQEEEKCLSIGINDYLAKPFRPEELFVKILNIERQIMHN